MQTKAELWYPAAASHFGQDYSAEKADIYTLDGISQSRLQEAVRDANAEPGPHPLIVYSHGTSRWQRLSATFLCSHLASNGYVVAAIDHYETTGTGLKNDDVAKNRPADITFLLNWVLADYATGDIHLEPSRFGAIGYCLGGWTVLRALEAEPRIRAAVVHAPAGDKDARPGVFSGSLTFKWKREIPVLFLVAENDTMTPYVGQQRLFKRVPSPKRAVVLRKADHMHFIDAVEEEHEFVRTLLWPKEMSWVSEEMHPVEHLCPGEKAQTFTAGLTRAFLDANLLWKDDARHWFGDGVREKLLALGIDAIGSG
ncbi:MAG: alpha/beta hydrolase family protein [Vulcanimicrobiaceae bacterium]